MRLDIIKSFLLPTWCVLILLTGSLLIPGESLSEEVEEVGVSFQPDKIVLNCPPTGEKQNIQANIGIILRGYRILDYDVVLLFDDDYVTDAVSFRVAWYHLEAGFDRSAVHDFAIENGLDEGVVIKATVKGSFTAESFDGITKVSRQFTGYDFVEIILQEGGDSEGPKAMPWLMLLLDD